MNTPGKAQAMKSFFLLVVLCAAVLLLGCQEKSMYEFGDGMVDTHAQRQNRYGNITVYHARMFADDFDTLWLADRPSYQSYWHLRDAD